MPHSRPHFRILIPMMSVFAIAATSPFEDTVRLDQQVAVHLNAAIGDAGGARAAIDTKLKLKRCPGAVQLSNTNKNAVLVSCPNLGWRIFVPVQGNQSRKPDQTIRKDEFVVFRNQPLTLVVERPNFSISYNVVAQKNGRIGDYIPVRASRKSKMLMARVSESGTVELAQ